MKTFAETLDYVETLQHKNDENDTQEVFRALVSDGEHATGVLLYELIAFSFGEHNESDELEWGTYFGPGFIFRNPQENTITISPDIKQVTQETIDYWKKRVTETNNPLLKARYAGLVWDMEKKITGNRPEINYAILNAESLLALSENDRYKHDVAVKDKLKRALVLAMGANRASLVEAARKAIISFEDKIAVDDKPGLWGFALEYLTESKKTGLTQEEEQKLVTALEERLERLATSQPNAHAAERAAILLADYYRKRSGREDVKRVMLKLAQACEADIEDGSALNKSGKLEHLHRLFTHYQLQEEAQAILTKLRSVSADAKSELQTFSQEVTIKGEDVRKFLDAILNGEAQEVLGRILSYFEPSKSESEKQLIELARNHPFSFLFPEKIIDERGRTVAQVGSIQTDLDGRVIRQISQSISFSAVFLNATLKEYFAKFNVTAKSFIEEYMKHSPAFEFARWQVIERALEAYFADDAMLFLHFIIPQIEDAFRTLVEKTGGQVLKTARGGGLHLKTFDDILRDEAISKIFGDDFALYSRILFTDQRGQNLRNDLCHGLMSEDAMHIANADRVFHVLMNLSTVSEKAPSDSSTDPGDVGTEHQNPAA